MGRQAYLVRLALGRSPYEPSEAVETTPSSTDSPDGSYTQAYDNKGNPQNPLRTQQIEAQIAAKNEVLAAVGVCERKNHDADQKALTSGKIRFSDDEWMVLREAENDYGELIRMVSECARNALTWWVVALRGRVQTGLLPDGLNFVDIVYGEFAECTRGGLRGAFRYLSAGAAHELFAQMLLTAFDWIVDDQFLKLETRMIRMKAGRKYRQSLLKWSGFGSRSLTVLFHVLVFPMSCFSSLQQLGLVSTPQTLPLACMLPWHPASPLRWAFHERQDQPLNSSRFWSILLSPGSLWVVATLAHDLLIAAHGHLPLCEQEAILGPHGQRHVAKAPQQTLFTSLKQARDWMLRLLGWSADREPQRNDDVLDNALTHGTNERTTAAKPPVSRRQRINELSMLPSHILALNLDNLFWNIALLPLDALFLRTLTASYLASPTAQRDMGLRSPGRVSPFLSGRGPFGAALGGGGGWSDAGAYASKVGLCMALQFTLDTTVFGAAYTWARWAGRTHFHWGAT